METWASGMIERSTASGWALVILVATGLFAQWRIHANQRPKMRELELAGKKQKIDIENEATDSVIELLRAEVRRLGERVIHLEQRVDELDTQKRVVTAERDAALADNARLRAVNLGQGQARQDAAVFVAAERAHDRLKGAGE